MRYVLSPNITAIVRGPASLVLHDGDATILGGPFVSHQRKIVSSQKQLPIETETRAELEITLGKSAEILEIPGSTIPASWRLTATALERMREGRLVVIGPPDVGKSTLCVYLVNKLLQSGQSVHIIDADIGQADIGPPTTIAGTSPTHPVASLQELTPDGRLFIGHISPSAFERKIISGIKRLAERSEGSLTIINTDGWVADREAILYKINLLTEVNPDLVLGIAYSNELEPILGGVHFHSMKIDAAKDSLKRSRIDRKSIRADGYRRFLEGGVTRRVHLGGVKLSLPPRIPRASAFNNHLLNNLIVGLLDNEDHLLEIGILIDIDREAAVIYSRRTEGVRKIEVGYVRLSMSGREIGFL